MSSAISNTADYMIRHFNKIALPEQQPAIQLKHFIQKLEDNNFKRISLEDREGKSNFPAFKTSPMSLASDQGQILGTTTASIPGYIGSGFEGSSTSGCTTGRSVPFNIFH